jgi:hypothetical protein
VPGLETVLVPARHDGPLGRARRVLTLGALLALLAWQAVAAVRDAAGELSRHGPAVRLAALRLDAQARRRANLGDDEALHRALLEHVEAVDPQLVLWFPAARLVRQLDVAPTVARVLGVNLGKVEGRVLAEAFVKPAAPVRVGARPGPP